MSNDDELLRQAMADNPGEVESFARAAAALGWLQHLAAPAAWDTVRSKIGDQARELLCGKVDDFIRYAESGKHHTKSDFPPASPSARAARARELRVLLTTWSPPELTPAIVEAARAVLAAEGLHLSDGQE